MSKSATVIININLDKFEFHCGSRCLQEAFNAEDNSVENIEGNAVKLVLETNIQLWIQAIGLSNLSFISKKVRILCLEHCIDASDPDIGYMTQPLEKQLSMEIRYHT